MDGHGQTRTDKDRPLPSGRGPEGGASVSVHEPPAGWGPLLWLGGSACAGKTSVASLLAERWGAAVYSLDDEFPRHRARASASLHPGFCALMDLPFAKLWEGSSVSQAEALLAFHRDQLSLALDDLAALDGPVIAEGVGVLPELLPPGACAAFLVADPAWRRRVHPRRGAWVEELLASCADPRAACESWMERDDRVARHVAHEAGRRGFPCLAVDGGRSLAETADQVAALLRLGEEETPAPGDARRPQR